jgi:hypothetical protein
MKMQSVRRIVRIGFSAFVLAGLLGICGVASAGSSKPAAKAAPAPAAHPAAKPSGGSGATHATGGASTHGPTAGGASTHGPTANGTASHGPTANGTAGGATTHGPTANSVGNAHSNAGPTAAGHVGGVNGGAGANAHGASNLNRSAFGGQTPRGSNERTIRSGSTLRTRSNGRVSDLHDVRRGVDVHHGLNGGSRSRMERPDHSRTNFERGRPGYVQRPYAFHGHDFARRTYFYHGRAYSHFYHGYGYRGMYLNVYAPGFYFGRGYYGWAYNPWAAPVHYGWGWGGSPWYGYYGYYFAPYPAYPSASYWLTDYMISADLQQAYAAHTEAGEANGAPVQGGGGPLLTPDVKQQISDEVRNQLALENQESQQNAQQQDINPGSSGIDRMLNDGHPHVFVVGTALDVVDNSGAECALSDGDVLALRTRTAPDATTVSLSVLASKGGQECQKQNVVSVKLDDLQEMQNHMRETIDQGLQELKDKAGKGGLPAAPSSEPTTPAAYAAIAPPQDPAVATELQQEAQQADQSENEVTAAAANQAATPASDTPSGPPANNNQ